MYWKLPGNHAVTDTTLTGVLWLSAVINGCFAM